jgi:putative membrane protein
VDEHAAHAHADHEAHATAAVALGMGILLAVCVGLVIVYLFAALRQRRRGAQWSGWRVASFVAGLGLVIVALLPPVAARAHADLRIHMAQHLLLGMLGPIGIVLGAPITLALRSLPRRTARRAIALLHGGPLRALVHPVTALVLNLGGMAVLYLTPLYAAMADHGALHVLVHVHFLAAGCLFAWAIAGAEPAAPVAPLRIRLIVVFVAIAAHGVLSKVMYAYGFPRGGAHEVAEVAEVEDAARIMYYGGDLAEVVLVIALLATVTRRARRQLFDLDRVGRLAPDRAIARGSMR